ncbi:hypothetical protein ES705_38773 [subsurface metagenome]
MALLWTYNNQQTIKPISENYPVNDFNQIAEEVQVEDLQKLLGFDFYQDIIQNPATEWNAKLLDGGTYEYNSVTYFYKGLKYTLAYLFYARYIKVSSKKDTYGGLVEKQFEESRIINSGDESNLHKDFRRIAFKYWEECQMFISANSAEFPYYYSDPLPSRCWDGYNRSYCF